MAAFKYWKNEGYIRGYEDGKIEDLNQSLIKNGVDENIREKIMRSGELIKKKQQE